MTTERFFLALCAASMLWASGALAHIDMDTGAGDHHKSRYGRNSIKNGPCGLVGGERGDNVYTYAPGETITVSVNEFIPHPGYFRIAFDDDGDDDFEDPATIDPENRACGADETYCGESDYYNNDTVLMDELEWDRTYPALGVAFEWEVTLPDVECDNCTLQVIQVMTEQGKAPYDPAEDNADDLYYQCIDLVLEGSTGGDGDGAGGDGDSAVDGGAGEGAGGDEGSSDDGGCSVATAGSPASSTNAPLAALAVGLALFLRRRTR